MTRRFYFINLRTTYLAGDVVVIGAGISGAFRRVASDRSQILLRLNPDERVFGFARHADEASR